MRKGNEILADLKCFFRSVILFLLHLLKRIYLNVQTAQFQKQQLAEVNAVYPNAFNILTDCASELAIVKPRGYSIDVSPPFLYNGVVNLVVCKAAKANSAPLDDDHLRFCSLILNDRIVQRLKEGSVFNIPFRFTNSGTPIIVLDKIVDADAFLNFYFVYVDTVEKENYLAEVSRNNTSRPSASPDDEEF